MKLFTTLFNVAKLPVMVAVDVVTVIPDLMSGYAFERTKDQCEEIDASISSK